MRLSKLVPDPQAVLAMDPGSMTGIVTWTPDGVIRPYSLPPQDVYYVLEEWTETWAQARAWLVVEKFTITANTGKMSNLGIDWPLKLTGVAEYLASRSGILCDTGQMPSSAKRFAPDARLRAAGWMPQLRAAEGKHDHARDAARHLLLALCENKVMEVPRVGAGD